MTIYGKRNYFVKFEDAYKINKYMIIKQLETVYVDITKRYYNT